MTEQDLLDAVNEVWRRAELLGGNGTAYPGPRAVVAWLRASPEAMAVLLGGVGAV